MLKILPKILSGISKIFIHYALSVFLLCLHYVSKLATFVTISWNILISECSIRVFHYS